MNRLAFLGFFLLSILSINPITQAQNCSSGNTQNTTCLLRENDKRCEGIINPDVSNDFTLISFAIGQLQPTQKLKIQIPIIANLSEPKVRIQSRIKYYQLDPLELKKTANQWTFEWDNNVLSKASISPNTLRGVAKANNVIIPVRFGQANTSGYDISIYTGNRTKNITLTIQQTNGNQVYSKTLTNQPGNEVKFSWNGKNQQGKIVPAGRYILTVNALIERKNDSPKERKITQQFEHNPSWLK
ncbi:hypothetical protein PCC8801_1298 [Rippkaea orientalis PCC 8801]|uniref:FlgD/Vpr Ig-like domain-containing protein n=1 Tax=Rippkaea orientalis (strain PCC 8801 / RF-1) TaxID=41431 RepID=B7K3M1_RIPO1|nr:FlgD immunoglobulin-like domain containing protein [Rippkaea orientalis]ACK65363.1 hypothetical protein PCC8801_1298 [Rippkaea orientalis PCC 8801]